MKYLSKLFFVCAVSLVVNGSPVFSAPPSTMSLQGTVADSNQLPVSGNRLYRVRFYDAQTAGTQLGNDFTGSVTLSPSGRFNVEILTPTAILDQSEVWYEVAVDIGNDGSINDPADVFADRVRVNSVPFAMVVDQVINGGTKLDGNGLVTDGKIGIGTTTPINELDVVGYIGATRSVKAGDGLIFGSGHSVYDIYGNGMDSDSTSTGDGALKFYTGGTSSNPSGAASNMVITNQGHVGIGTQNPDEYLHVKNGDSRFDNDLKVFGNIGIGTNSPLGILHIQGTDVTNSPNSTGIRFSRVAGSALQDWLISTGVAGLSNNYLAIKDITDNEYRMVFDDNGNVGIGTESPSYKLDVDGHIRVTGVDSQVATSGSGIEFAYVSNENSGHIDVTDRNNSNRLDLGLNHGTVTIKGDSRLVGIGTNNPQAKLDVSGGHIRISNNFGFIDEYSNGMDTETLGQLDFRAGGTSSQSGSVKMRINNNGRVGIGYVSPQYTLDVNGDIASNHIVLTSDKRYKKNIKTISSPLDTLSQLRGVEFDWRVDEFEEKEFTSKHQVGVIAQEIEEILPEVVHTSENGYKAVEYSKLVPVLIEAIKEQLTLFETQQSLIDELRREIEQLKNQ